MIDDKLQEVLGLCGCVSYEILEDFLKVMQDIKYDKDRKDEDFPSCIYLSEKYGWSEKYTELILLVLDDKGFAEHGTSVRGSWLTKEGEELLKDILIIPERQA